MAKIEQAYYVAIRFSVYASSDEEAVKLAKKECSRIQEDHAIVTEVNKKIGQRISFNFENLIS